MGMLTHSELQSTISIRSDEHCRRGQRLHAVEMKSRSRSACLTSMTSVSICPKRELTMSGVFAPSRAID